MCFEVFCLGFILFGTLWVSWTWVVIYFSILGKFSTIISSSIFSCPFFLSSSSGTLRIRTLGYFTLSQGLWGCPHFFLILFNYFHHPIFHLTCPIFCLSYSTVGSSRVLLISVIALFIIDWLFFVSSRSLLNISCIFSILVACQVFLVGGVCGLCSDGWSWISSLCSAMKCPVVNSEVSMGLAWLWAACLLMLRGVFLLCLRISMVCLALEIPGSWMELGFSVGMETFGWALVY